MCSVTEYIITLASESGIYIYTELELKGFHAAGVKKTCRPLARVCFLSV